MSELPKCTSRWGHRFEGRYSFKTTSDIKLGPVRGMSPASFEQLVRAFQDKTYEGDVCVRCGAVVNKRNPAPK